MNSYINVCSACLLRVYIQDVQSEPATVSLSPLLKRRFAPITMKPCRHQKSRCQHQGAAPAPSRAPAHTDGQSGQRLKYEHSHTQMEDTYVVIFNHLLDEVHPVSQRNPNASLGVV